MFETKACISITWNKDRHVFGISLNRDAKNDYIIEQTFCDNEEYTFAERLKNVYDKLKNNQDQLIIIGGYIPSSVSLELNIPPLSKKDTEQYLYYELTRQIPYPVNELKWWYKPLPQKENYTEQSINVFAVLEKEWNELLGEIILSEIKVDSFIYPFMVVNSLSRNTDIKLMGIDEEFFLTQSTEIEDSYMKMISFSNQDRKSSSENNDMISDHFKEKYTTLNMENINDSIPALILAEYCLTKQYLKDRKLHMEIPNELHLDRFKLLKITAITLFIIFIILSSTYAIRQMMDTMNTLSTLTSEKTLLLNTIKKINSEYSQNRKYDKIINEIKESTPKTINPIKYLQALTKAVPGNIWMTSFASSKDKVNVTLQTKSDAGNVIAALNKSQLFRTENVRKRKTSNGIQYIYLTLKPRVISNQ